MKLIQSEIATKIRGYNPASKKVQTDPQQLIADAKKFQKWVNSRIDSLAAAGVPKNVSVGRMKKIPVKEIKTEAQAKRAIARAKKLANNPLSSVKNYKSLIREAEKTFGTKGAHGGWKIITDPNDPTKPIAVPRGSSTAGHHTNYLDARRLVVEFWEWYEKLGQLYLDSHQVKECLTIAARTGADPIIIAEQMILDLYGEEIFNDYIERYNSIFGTQRKSRKL